MLRDNIIAALFWFFALYAALFGSSDHRARYGDSCGPLHHWVHVGESFQIDSDLSCEPD